MSNFEEEIRKVRLRLEQMPPKIHARLLRAIERQCLLLTAHVKENYLSGQVLKVQTGTLRTRTTYRMIDQGNSITGIVGTNVPYAAYHEYGYHGNVNVHAHQRTSSKGLRYGVSAHSRMVNYQGRPFLRPAFESRTSAIVQALRNAVEDAVK